MGRTRTGSIKKKTFGVALCLLALATIPYAQSADVAARDAALRLEEALGGGTARAAPPPVRSTRGRKEPAWVNDPYRVFSRERYVVAVGYGANRAEAERRALAALTSLFGQSVQSEFSAVTAYSEAVSNSHLSYENFPKVLTFFIKYNTLGCVLFTHITVCPYGRAILRDSRQRVAGITQRSSV